MVKKIDYKHQLERLDEIVSAFFADKTLGNAFSEYDQGHRKASMDFSRDMIKLIKKAKKGEL